MVKIHPHIHGAEKNGPQAIGKSQAKRSRVHRWEYDIELYEKRNEIEKFFLRLRFRGDMHVL
jgi:hypothetical protein